MFKEFWLRDFVPIYLVYLVGAAGGFVLLPVLLLMVPRAVECDVTTGATLVRRSATLGTDKLVIGIALPRITVNVHVVTHKRLL